MAQFNERACKIALARKSFWDYCKLFAPDFYMDDRTYLHECCDAFQAFYESEEELLVVCAPPRHGKSRTATLFVQWVLGNYPKDKIVTGSYNETLSTVFSKAVRNKIQESAADSGIVYHEVFPNTRVKRGDAAANLWGIEGNETNSYLATSPSGTVTGFGADLILIDDLIKNEYEARNETIKDNHWRWFTDTLLSRREGKRKIIVVQTRWATDDLAGRLIVDCTNRAKTYKLLSYAAWDGHGMLCDAIMTHAQYQDLFNSDMGRDIVEANYNQSPIDMVGRLYTALGEYDELPDDIVEIINYTDTADEGDDFLTSIDCAIDSKGIGYLIDVIYTQDSMEKTEPAVARMVTKDNVNYMWIESNNGGRGWGRNVARIAMEELDPKNTTTRFKFFTQTKNKEARILTGSTGVMNRLRFPKGWERRWPEYHRDMLRYQRIGKNAHDDAQDATTGIYEHLPIKPSAANQEKIITDW